ncbi:hypothetical protein SOVF_105480 [Spinacia oleracea]|nr:hypothetical protein SOVF_105480 [Spinacia oleracea]
MRGSDKSPIYRFYGVVVHLDIMNASFSGHYVSYARNARNKWYKTDDSMVYWSRMWELERVLNKGAYVPFYSSHTSLHLWIGCGNSCCSSLVAQFIVCLRYHRQAGISGGVSLPVYVDKFFEAIEITVQTGYGLTESVNLLLLLLLDNRPIM